MTRLNDMMIKSRIKKGSKYRRFADFVRKNAENIGAICFSGLVYYQEGEKLFVEKDDGEKIRYVWNPKFEDPFNAPENWKSFYPFKPEAGERNWTYEEEIIIKELVRDILPGGMKNWEQPDVYFPEGRNTRMFLRKVPSKTRRSRNRLKNPY